MSYSELVLPPSAFIAVGLRRPLEIGELVSLKDWFITLARNGPCGVLATEVVDALDLLTRLRSWICSALGSQTYPELNTILDTHVSYYALLESARPFLPYDFRGIPNRIPTIALNSLDLHETLIFTWDLSNETQLENDLSTLGFASATVVSAATYISSFLGSYLSGQQESSTVKQTHLFYEMACVLYNIATLYAMQACRETLNSSSSIRSCCDLFQRSAGAFATLSERLSSCGELGGCEIDFFLQPGVLRHLIASMLAQAAECSWIMATMPLRSKVLKYETLMHVAADVAAAYESATNLSDLGTKQTIGLINFNLQQSFMESRIKHFKSKSLLFNSIAEYYMSKSLEGADYGLKIARIQRSIENAKHAIKLSPKIPKSFLLQLEQSQIAAEKENDTVYFVPIPEYSIIPGIISSPKISLKPELVYFTIEGAATSKSGGSGGLEIAQRNFFSSLPQLDIAYCADIYHQKRKELLDLVLSKTKDLGLPRSTSKRRRRVKSLDFEENNIEFERMKINSDKVLNMLEEDKTKVFYIRGILLKEQEDDDDLRINISKEYYNREVSAHLHQPTYKRLAEIITSIEDSKNKIYPQLKAMFKVFEVRKEEYPDSEIVEKAMLSIDRCISQDDATMFSRITIEFGKKENKNKEFSEDKNRKMSEWISKELEKSFGKAIKYLNESLNGKVKELEGETIGGTLSSLVKSALLLCQYLEKNESEIRLEICEIERKVTKIVEIRNNEANNLESLKKISEEFRPGLWEPSLPLRFNRKK